MTPPPLLKATLDFGFGFKLNKIRKATTKSRLGARRAPLPIGRKEVVG